MPPKKISQNSQECDNNIVKPVKPTRKISIRKKTKTDLPDTPDIPPIQSIPPDAIIHTLDNLVLPDIESFITENTTANTNNIDSSKYDMISSVSQQSGNSNPKSNIKSNIKPDIKPDITFNSILEELEDPELVLAPDTTCQIVPQLLNYNYTIPIKTVYHISDLHIPLYKRHDEYLSVFNNLLTYLKQEKARNNISEAKNVDIPMVIVITGDILHSKSDLSPECIQMTYNIIKNLAGLMPVIMIPGNHDINMNNRDRLDSLTPILADMPLNYPIYYLLNSGVYKMVNLTFYHASIFDYQIIHPSQVLPITQDSNYTITQNENTITQNTNIMLYHGRVNGAVLFNGISLSDEGKKTITPSTFAPYDITMLGDIHKHQFLADNIAYAGSLIQQNIGEDIHPHGLIRWDVSNCTGEMVSIPNDWSYITIRVISKQTEYNCILDGNGDGNGGCNGKHDPNCRLSKNIRIRILYTNTPESYLMDLITLLKMNHNILEYSWQNDDSIYPISSQSGNDLINSNPDTNTNSNTDSNPDTNSSNPSNPSNSSNSSNPSNPSNLVNRPLSIVDITQPDIQMKYITEYLREYDPNITPVELEEIRLLNTTQNILLKESNKTYGEVAFNGHYKIKRLEFSNLFSFGPNNVIDFTYFKGVVGIIAANHLGKSSIIDIIIYTLFDEFTRKGSTKDIININKEDFRIKMDINIGQWTYTIIKTGNRTKVGVSVRVEFYRMHDTNGIIERLEEDNSLKTKERISEYFGSYDDIIHTSFSIQHDNACFIDSTNIKRKDELERIMRFEIVKRLFELANAKYNKQKAIYEHIKKKIRPDDITVINKDRKRSIRRLNRAQNDLDYAKNRIKELNETILLETRKLHAECSEFLEEHDEGQTLALYNRQIKELADLESKINHSSHNADCNADCNVVKDHIPDTNLDNETRWNTVVKDTTKKIKIIDQTLEKLFKSRKAIITKIPPAVIATEVPISKPNNDHQIVSELSPNPVLSFLEYTKNRKEKELKHLDDNITTIQNQISDLVKIEDEIEKCNTTLLEIIQKEAESKLQAKNQDLPEYLKLLIQDKDILEDNYITIQDKLFRTILENHNIIRTDSINATPILVPLFEEYEQAARKYYTAIECESIQNTSSSQLDDQLSDHMDARQVIENRIKELKQQLKRKPILESEIKTHEKSKYTLHNEITNIIRDITNWNLNTTIDIDISKHKEKRATYDRRIENANEQLQQIKEKRMRLLEYDALQNKIKTTREILDKFETYRQQIRENEPILDRISCIQDEIEEFEDVVPLVEKVCAIEHATVIKMTTLLEQIKKDVEEGRKMEQEFRILELYRATLKQLPFILLAKIQPILEKKVNDLLTIITDFTVKFEIADGKIDIYLDRPIYNTNTKSKSTSQSRYIIINNASGFERFIASVAIRLALLEISNLPKINFMAIDEGWSSFDTHNINNVGVILDYLTSKFDFILTISHLSQIKEHCDIQLSLKKDINGFSKII